MASPQTPFIVGVLALQGAFHEHLTHISRVSSTESDEDSTKAGQSSQVGQVQGIPVRTPEQLALCHALIIPGGESTAIALGAVRGGLLEPLRQWVRSGKPTWGTCAGMIMLAREATGGKKMQELIGGWDGRVSRNGWGSQVESFEASLNIPALSTVSAASSSDLDPFTGVFIRAPAVERLFPPQEVSRAPAGEPVAAGRREGEELDDVQLVQSKNIDGAEVGTPQSLPSPHPEAASSSVRLAVAPPMLSTATDGESVQFRQRPPIEVIARLSEGAKPATNPGPDSDVVALLQGNVFVTSFHPELTRDNRLHRWWVREARRAASRQS
ncbi:unnamed protein product [Jaminaea pallidilutea]